MNETTAQVTKGDGYAVANLSDLGDGPGFRKIRKDLGVTAFGVNAIVLPPSYSTGGHYHDEQEELYFLHSGQIAIEFGDGTQPRAGARRPRLGRRLNRPQAPQPQRLRGRGLRHRRRQGRIRGAGRETA